MNDDSGDEQNPHDFIDESFRRNFWGLGWDFIVEAPDETYVKTDRLHREQ